MQEDRLFIWMICLLDIHGMLDICVARWHRIWLLVAWPGNLADEDFRWSHCTRLQLLHRVSNAQGIYSLSLLDIRCVASSPTLIRLMVLTLLKRLILQVPRYLLQVGVSASWCGVKKLETSYVIILFWLDYPLSANGGPSSPACVLHFYLDGFARVRWCICLCPALASRIQVILNCLLQLDRFVWNT